MIGDHDARRTFIHASSSVFSRENALDDDRPAPGIANPAKVVPSEGQPLYGRVRMADPQSSAAGSHDIRQRGKAAIEQESSEPSWMRQELRKKWNLRPKTSP